LLLVLSSLALAATAAEDPLGLVEQFVQAALVGSGEGAADVQFDVRVEGDSLPVAALWFSGA